MKNKNTFLKCPSCGSRNVLDLKEHGSVGNLRYKCNKCLNKFNVVKKYKVRKKR